ncbi:tRNA 2-selenouridine(34) synthase MnmH [Microbacter margulisiae]|uniref:tRNA 2-selenouridine synthase n=1 Tax=Microbacter margulisiae TaxID=1350067 RepID=A0A7W5DPW1_9PORP|nr:tRNA 2-selenouridine(34) synthase MnmH [Microbacter margulisiae]MBB3186384.1 tRNA 2-selenouridine synthase [Microbacter margulisiae]
MATVLPIDVFLQKMSTLPVVDVRTPAEFIRGHMPNAVNLSLFSDEERAVVGTLYHQQGKQAAVLQGLAFVSPHMKILTEEALALESSEIGLYCWRGGMRSQSMAWLFETVDLKCFVCDGGYKAFRNHALAQFEKPLLLRVIAGPTGSAKTAILHELAALGEQIIDLEDLAYHRGSAFGALGQKPQSTTEDFENRLYEIVSRLDPTRPVWVEDESMMIGKNQIPLAFFRQMHRSTAYYMLSSLSDRIDFLMKEYACFPKEDLIASIQLLERRLGRNHCQEAVKACEEEDCRTAISIVLQYYDKAYAKALIEKPYPEVINIMTMPDLYSTALYLKSLVVK